MPKPTETETFTVAKGRSLSHQPDPKSRVTHYGPGDSVELTVDEGARLRSLGFLLGDDGELVAPAETDGPATVNGAEIKEA